MGLQFMLLMRLGRSSDALLVCSAAVERFSEPLMLSTWLLRRGLLHVDWNRRNEALEDLQRVIVLDASLDHQKTARQALLRVAGMSN
jgi:transposase